VFHTLFTLTSTQPHAQMWITHNPAPAPVCYSTNQLPHAMSTTKTNSSRKPKPNAQELALAFLNATVKYKGVTLNLEDDLLYHQNEQCFYYYNSYYWKRVDDDTQGSGIMHLLTTTLISEFPNVSATRSLRRDVLDLVQLLTYRKYNQTHPSPITAFTDALFDWTTFAFTPLNRDAYAFHAYDFPAPLLNAPTPAFDDYLRTCFPNDPHTQTFVQQMMGYYLSPSPQPYVFFLYGKAATGKSVFLELMHQLIGPAFTSSIHLEPLTRDKFSIIGLANKKVNIVDEDESDYINAGKLKALASHAPTEAQKKFGQPFKFTPYTKFLFASNQFPNFKDVDGGTKRRLFFIHYSNPIPVHKQDVRLINKLRAELPGIVGKVIESARTFYKNKQRFDESATSQRAKGLFLDHALPEIDFFSESYKTHPSRTTYTQTIYNSYRAWCSDNGKYPKNKQNFCRILLEHFDNITTSRDRSGKRWNVVAIDKTNDPR